MLDRGVTLILAVPLLVAGFGVTGMIIGMAAGNLVIGLVALSMATEPTFTPWHRCLVESLP